MCEFDAVPVPTNLEPEEMLRLAEVAYSPRGASCVHGVHVSEEFGGFSMVGARHEDVVYVEYDDQTFALVGEKAGI